MSEDFEKIKNEVMGFRQAAENKIELEKRAVEERTERDKRILEESGVRQLFKEIRDSGLVRWRVKTADELRNRKKFFTGYEEKLDYIPAGIAVGVGRYETNEEGYAYGDGVSLSLQFDCSQATDSNDRLSDAHSEIRIAVVRGELFLVGNNRCGYSYTPIKEGELVTTIANALKTPPMQGIFSGYGFCV